MWINPREQHYLDAILGGHVHVNSKLDNDRNAVRSAGQVFKDGSAVIIGGPEVYASLIALLDGRADSKAVDSLLYKAQYFYSTLPLHTAYNSSPTLQGISQAFFQTPDKLISKLDKLLPQISLDLSDHPEKFSIITSMSALMAAGMLPEDAGPYFREAIVHDFARIFRTVEPLIEPLIVTGARTPDKLTRSLAFIQPKTPEDYQPPPPHELVGALALIRFSTLRYDSIFLTTYVEALKVNGNLTSENIKPYFLVAGAYDILEEVDAGQRSLTSTTNRDYVAYLAKTFPSRLNAHVGRIRRLVSDPDLKLLEIFQPQIAEKEPSIFEMVFIYDLKEYLGEEDFFRKVERATPHSLKKTLETFRPEVRGYGDIPLSNLYRIAIEQPHVASQAAKKTYWDTYRKILKQEGSSEPQGNTGGTNGGAAPVTPSTPSSNAPPTPQGVSSLPPMAGHPMFTLGTPTSLATRPPMAGHPMFAIGMRTNLRPLAARPPIAFTARL